MAPKSGCSARAGSPLAVLAAGLLGVATVLLFLWPFDTRGGCGGGSEGACPDPVSHALVGYELALAPSTAQVLALVGLALVGIATLIGLIATTRPLRPGRLGARPGRPT